MSGRMAVVLAFVAGAGIAGCAGLQATDAVRTVPHFDVAKNAENYLGRVIRTCAPIYKPFLDTWALVAPTPAGNHDAIVLVVPCPSSKLEATREGKCVAGRVAALNGSLRQPKSDITAINLHPSSRPWYIHEQCPAAAAAG